MFIRKVHLILGMTVVVLFTLTGQYMHHLYNHLSEMEPMPRALFRAGHIYILLFGLINLILGYYFELSSTTYKRTFQIFGSALIVLATFLVIGSFFVELPSDQVERPLSRWALYMMLAGCLSHGLKSLNRK